MYRSFLFVFLFWLQAGFSQNLDYRVLHQLNKNTYPQWDAAMKHLSFSVYVLEPIPPVAISLHGYFKKDKTILWNGYKSAISLCFALAVSTAMKYGIDRPRPYQSYPNDIIRRDHSDTPSFPSGHTTAAFATATSLSLTYKKWYVVVPAFAYAGLAAYSRMRLGMHYPTDVAAGMVIGSGSALLTWKIAEIIAEKRKKKTLIPGD